MSADANQAWVQAAAAFRNSSYLRHNQRRQEHLAGLGLDLHGRTVLDVGAGIGDHATFFIDRGCTVVSVEGRAEACAAYLMIFPQQGYVGFRTPRVIHAPVEALADHVSDVFDVVYCYGLLYHTADPLVVLRNLRERCGDLLLLETKVSPGDDEAIHPIAEPTRASEALHGMGCRPTRPWVFNRLKELFEHVYVPLTQPAHEDFPLDWHAPRGPDQPTRAIFIGARRPLDNGLLLDHLPDRQVRAP